MFALKKFVITIAREYGSGGKSIGKLLAKELGVSFYSREILRLASEKSGINESLFANADEKLKSTLLFRTARGALPLFLLHLAAELLSFWCVAQVLFRGRLELGPAPVILSNSNSLCIGMFGVFWFLSVCFLLGLLGKLISPFLKKTASNG